MMIRTRSRENGLRAVRGIVVLSVALAGLLHSGRAEAQWGMGYGFWGYNPNDGTQITEAINQRSAIAAQAAFAARQNIMPSLDGPNSYRNFVRDTNFVDRVGISTRRAIGATASASPAPPRQVAAATPAPAPAPATPAPAPKPVISLASFFNRANVLVWPADAPFSGGLDIKRAASDRATRVVYDEVKSRGIASVSSVTEARNLLLDYGRPALQYLRDTATPQVADTFHQFLLSLYEALAQAGNPPAQTPR